MDKVKSGNKVQSMKFVVFWVFCFTIQHLNLWSHCDIVLLSITEKTEIGHEEDQLGRLFDGRWGPMTRKINSFPCFIATKMFEIGPMKFVYCNIFSFVQGKASISHIIEIILDINWTILSC